MRALSDVIDLPLPHTDARGKPASTLENVEAIIEAFGVVVARPPLNAETFTPFFPRRYRAESAELVRDVHRRKLHDICLRHGIDISARQLARHLQLIGLEQEDAERSEANEKRLARGLA